ncbi:MAG: hypothetical protein RL168_403 [Bacteroidota bacterium]
MNFLAHLVLSPGGEKIMAGNFFADQVKGHSWQQLEEDYAQGVLLHRRIDTFVDAHPLVQQAKQHLDSRFGLFKGVLLDVFWDHFLAKNLDRHAGLPLIPFVDHAHETLAAHAPYFHPNAVHLVAAMKRGQWLTGYAHLSEVDAILKQMSARFPHANPMGQGLEALEASYESLERIFGEFWPAIRAEFATYSMP